MRDYESMAYLAESVRFGSVAEVYSGEGVVGWHGNIERQVDRLLSTYDAARNQPYTDKLTAFLRIWRNNPMSGSINVEDVEKLLSATEVLAVDNWNLKNYFSNLRDQLRKLKASEEEMPRGGAPDGGMGGGIGGGIGGIGGPKPSIGSMDKEISSDFGPDSDKLERPNSNDLPPSPDDESPNVNPTPK